MQNIPDFSSLRLLSTLIEKNKWDGDRYVIEIESGDIDLKQILDVRNFFTIDEASHILMNLSRNYCLLEENGVAHCDVKPDNVILSLKENDSFDYIISDFGISVSRNPGEKKILCIEMQGMTKFYAAPEVKEIEFLDFENNEELQKREYDPFLADVYSLGVVLLKLLNTSSKEISNSMIPLHLLINQMLSKDPLNRPRFSEIFKKCKEFKSIGAPKGIQNNIIEYRKYMEKKKYINYLSETFYKYLDLNIENQAQLYLDTIKSVDVEKTSEKMEIEIVQGDFVLLFKKNIDQALIFYNNAISMQKDQSIFDETFNTVKLIANLRIISMFDMYKTNKNSFQIKKEISDAEILNIIEPLEKNIFESDVYHEVYLTDLGKNNLALHKCLSEEKMDELLNLFQNPLENNTTYILNNVFVGYQKIINDSENANKVFEDYNKSLKKNIKWNSVQNPMHISILEENIKKIEKKDYNNLKFIYLFGNTYETIFATVLNV